MTRANLGTALLMAVVFPGITYLWSRQEEVVHNRDKACFNSPKDNKYM